MTDNMSNDEAVEDEIVDVIDMEASMSELINNCTSGVALTDVDMVVSATGRTSSSSTTTTPKKPWTGLGTKKENASKSQRAKHAFLLKKNRSLLLRSYGLGKDGGRCGVCFEREVTETTRRSQEASPFVQCTDCGLLVHSQCFDPTSEINVVTGMFLCDVCNYLARARAKSHARESPDGTERRRSSSRVSPGPLPAQCEWQDDGRLYPSSPVDVFCTLCLRRDVTGGMKRTNENPGTHWAHLSCSMSNNYVHFRDGRMYGVGQALRANNKLITEEWEEPPVCEICTRPGGYLMHCAYVPDINGVDRPKDDHDTTTPKKRKKQHNNNNKRQCQVVVEDEQDVDVRCPYFVHPLCAELAERERVVEPTARGDVIFYHCAAHSGYDKCVVCHKANRPNAMLECDGCADGYHMFCMDPPLTEVPEDDWFCKKCRSSSSSNSAAGKKRKGKKKKT